MSLYSEPIPRHVNDFDESFESEELSIRERSVNEMFDALEITKLIRELATPKFLGLDRKIYEGRNIDRFRNRRIFSNQKFKRKPFENGRITGIDSSLEDVQVLIYEYFRKIAQQQPKISEEFKRKIFQLSFKFNDDHNLDYVLTDTDSLMDKKTKVLTAINDLDLKFLANAATRFFDDMANIIISRLEIKNSLANYVDNEESKKENERQDFRLLMKWVNNSSQLKQIEDIIIFSQTYQEKIAELRSPIKRLESIASKFFKEANKSIVIADDGELSVNLGNNKTASVYELSSGEKQIIIMIAHLIFEEDQKPSGVFIIDEPELSLHIAWQEVFVSSIMEASPKTQFILATHAPSIISVKNREILCQDLTKMNF